MVLPLMIMGGLMVCGGLGALMLPETLHQHLPQTLEEGELFGRDFDHRHWLTCCPPQPQTQSQPQPQPQSQPQPQPTAADAKADADAVREPLLL